jgi:hypothetical protein
MKVWVNDYQNERGDFLGRLLSISPSLHILLEDSPERPQFVGFSTGAICNWCHADIIRHPLRVHGPEQRGLYCECLRVLYKVPVFTDPQILPIGRICGGFGQRQKLDSHPRRRTNYEHYRTINQK